MQDYLELNGIKPLFENNGIAYYKYNDKIPLLLDRYEIKYNIQPNREKSIDYGRT